ncbi:hypothetical protein [Burkholderia sp. LMG 21824]|uniref:hypothetical protein n=1 Tax=Burkholderia sp. LMG 21824 TaxID=3158172 RepID=UPI003C2B455E
MACSFGSDAQHYFAGRLVQWAVEQLLVTLLDLTEPERRRLDELSPYAFRHTFGMQSVVANVPLDVVQALLGQPTGAAPACIRCATRSRTTA